MIQDPADEVVEAVRRTGDADPSAADRAAMALARRRFGVALPPPFADLPPPPAPLPVREAMPADGAAIAAVKWRAWRAAYPGVLPDDFLAALDVAPPASAWIMRAQVPPSRRHRLLVAGPPGTVAGFADVRPAREDDLDTDALELHHLYVDPTAQGRGAGRALLDAAVDHARALAPSALVLWTFSANAPARRFYEAHGWVADGVELPAEIPGLPVPGTRYRLVLDA